MEDFHKEIKPEIKSYLVLKKRRLEDMNDRAHEEIIKNVINTGASALSILLFTVCSELVGPEEVMKSNFLVSFAIAMSGITTYSTIKLLRSISEKTDLKVEEEKLQEELQKLGISADNIESGGYYRK